MSQQARFSLPPALGGLTTAEMQRVIRQANVGAENEKIAELYFVERRPQVDVAAELYLGRATALHDCVLGHMEAYRQKGLEVPVAIMAVYEYSHDQQIEKAERVKRYQSMYRKS